MPENETPESQIPESQLPESQLPESQLPGSMETLTDNPEEGERSSRTNWWLAAIVALLVALIAVQISSSNNQSEPVAIATTTTTATDQTQVPATESTTTTVVATTTTSSSVPDSTTTTLETTGSTTVGEIPLTRVAAEKVVQEWITFLSLGDTDSAWALVSVPSQVAFGGRSAFDRSSTDLAEGYGAWADAEDLRTFVASVEPDGPDFDLVVTLSGNLMQEGELSYSAVAIPVTMEDGHARVSPFLDNEMISFVLPSPDNGVPVVPSGARFELVFPSEGAFVVYVDGTPVVNFFTETEDGGSLVGFGSPIILNNGNHTITAIYLGKDGSIHARAVAFSVGENG